MRPNEADEMHFDELRRAVAAASRDALPSVVAMIWRAYGDELITEDEAGELSGLIEARKVQPAAPAARRCGSRPITGDSLARRRRWAASGSMPPALAAHFTQGEVAVLAVVALEVGRTGSCQWPHARIAAVAGVSVSTVKRAMAEAKRLGLIEVQERRQTWWRNLSNIVQIVSPEWVQWINRGGVQRRTGTVNTNLQKAQGPAETGFKATEKRAGGGRRCQDGPRIVRGGSGRRSAGPACG